MSEFWIIMTGEGGYGHFGKGLTRDAAMAALKKAGGRKRGTVLIEFRFTSELPFAPMDRPAKDTEADAWVGRDGSLNWVRCKREKVSESVLFKSGKK